MQYSCRISPSSTITVTDTSTKTTTSVEEWVAKAPLSDLHLCIIDAIKLDSEKVLEDIFLT
jgi:hypothetical protein